MRAVVLLVLAACSDDVEITRLPGSPSATRALTFFDDGQPIAIGGESEFGLAYLQTPGSGDTWTRAVDVPAFDANAKLLRGSSDIFAIGTTQVHRWERANDGGGFAWTTINIPIGTTENTAFAVDDLGHIFAVELEPDGAGAIWRWRTDTIFWEEVPMTRPIGVGATSFAVSSSGNSVAWSVPGVGISWVDAGGRSEIPCARVGGCNVNVRDLAFHGEDSLSALICEPEATGLRAVVSLSKNGTERSSTFRDESCRSLSSIAYGTRLVVADGVYIVHDTGHPLVRIADADPDLTYVLYDASTAYAYGDGIYKIDF